jgi:phosphoribosylanthranilate isomerase
MKPEASIAHPRTRIKICGLTREQDVDAAVAAGADAVGFVMYAASPRHVSPQRAAELARRLPPFVTPVLLFVNESALNIRSACDRLAQACVQFHGDESPADCLAATGGGARPFMRAARIPLDDTTPFDLVKFASDYSSAQALLLDAHVEGYGGGGKAFNWSRLPPSVNAHLVLSGGLTPANVTDGIVQVRPRCKTLAVDVSSGVEVFASGGATLKGIKDPEKINQFVAAVRAADALLAKSTHALLSTT